MCQVIFVSRQMPIKVHIMQISINALPEDRSKPVSWGYAQSDLGNCTVAGYDGELCWLDIAPGTDAAEQLAAHFGGCELVRDDQSAQTLLDESFAALLAGRPLRLRVAGTAFQLQVWQALTRIEPGQSRTYGQLAEAIGRPGAARAVGSAAAANVIAVFIPCHRLVPAGDQPGAYRWGAALKQELLAAEKQAA